MGFLLDKCSFSPLNEEVIAGCRPFSCGNADLDEFFRHDAPLYSKQMLGKSYCFRLDEDSSVMYALSRFPTTAFVWICCRTAGKRKYRKTYPIPNRCAAIPEC